ncbi:hypothetical protein ACFXHA_45245 [Nocardia sp. NPDC059240]|uniref:hypothetical protein n=1 Tax=Nocardia sp. NPDC059240 TaxID=3346786 RepID=UPI00368169CB
MSDVTFPARLTVTSDPDLDGLPILSATVTPSAEAATQELPKGQLGPAGPRGGPRTTFRKVGTLASAVARPTGLGPDDRGKWWHRLDSNGMDVWVGDGWFHSPNAVGAQGLTADALTVTATTNHAETLTEAALTVTANGRALTLAATAPAGLQGPPGPTGSSGTISAATDFDNTVGPTHRGLFAYQPAARRWKVAAPPNGFSQWSWFQEDFLASTSTANPSLTVASLALPALPFAWRPMVWLAGWVLSDTDAGTYPILAARLGSPTGVMVSYGAGIRSGKWWYHITSFPTFGDDGPKPLSPASTYASVPAGEKASILVTVEKIGTAAGNLSWDRTLASAVVWALPIGG